MHIKQIIISLLIVLSSSAVAQEWIDMGTKADNGAPMFWASGNIIEENGQYYIGSYIEKGTKFHWGALSSSEHGHSLSCPDGDISGDKQYDIAAKRLAEGRTPTADEWGRLFDQCDIKYTSIVLEPERENYSSDPLKWMYGDWEWKKLSNWRMYYYLVKLDENYFYKRDYSAESMTGSDIRGDYTWKKSTYSVTRKSNGELSLVTNFGVYTINTSRGELRVPGEMALTQTKRKYAKKVPAKTVSVLKLTSRINGNTIFLSDEDYLTSSIASKKPYFFRAEYAYNVTGYHAGVKGNKSECISQSGFQGAVRPVKDDTSDPNYNGNYGFLRVSSSNRYYRNAPIFIDGKKIGVIKDADYIVSVGTHQIRVEPSGGYPAFEDRITINRHRKTDIIPLLQVANIKIHVEGGQNPENKNILIHVHDNTLSVSDLPRTIAVPPGDYTVSTSASKYYAECSQDVHATVGDNSCTLVLPELFETVSISTLHYNGSDIYVDGKHVGTGNAVCKLLFGKHTIEWKSNIHKTYTQTITCSKPGRKMVEQAIETPTVTILSNHRNSQISLLGDKNGKPGSYENKLVLNHPDLGKEYTATIQKKVLFDNRRLFQSGE